MNAWQTIDDDAPLTLLDSPAPKTSRNRIEEQRRAIERFIKNIEIIDASNEEPLGEEFDRIVNQRLSFNRETEL